MMKPEALSTTEPYPEVAATLLFDTGIGKLGTDDLAVDPTQLTEFMRTQGMTDQEILGTTIHFSAAAPKRAIGWRMGHHDKKQARITVFVGTHTLALDKAMAEAPEEIDKTLSEVLNETLLHELTHRADLVRPWWRRSLRTNARNVLQTIRPTRIELGAAAIVGAGYFVADKLGASRDELEALLLGSSLIAFCLPPVRRARYLNAPHEQHADATAESYVEAHEVHTLPILFQREGHII